MLTSRDLAQHAALGIDPAILAAAGVRRVDDSEGRQILGINGKAGNFAGVLYPYVDPVTQRPRTSRIRIDHPPIGSDGKPDGKYRQPYGDRRALFFPPDVAATLDDPTVPAILVESEKAALAIASAAHRAPRRVLALALGGCWNWRGRIGIVETASGSRVAETGILPDFHRIAWTGRPTYIAFDARPNESVQAAGRGLAVAVSGFGADVWHVTVPDDDGAINGPDDYIGARGDAAWWHLVDAAHPHDFTRDPKGRVVDSFDNVRTALGRLRLTLRENAFTHTTELDGQPVDDPALQRLIVACADHFGYRPSPTTLVTLFTADGARATYHPVRDYLDGLTWDGTPRLDAWLVTYGGATDAPYVQAVGALPLIAAVRRVRHPGTKFDELLVLESPQGTLKSTAIRTLCPDEAWFSDDLPLGIDSKETVERTAGKWLIEGAELHGSRGREAEQLKTFLSRQVDGPVRMAYARLPASVPRQFVLIGTTNARVGYLKDATGGRRFWPVPIRGFDVDALRRDRDQLWAEAALREAGGASTRLDASLWAAASEAQEDRRAGDPWEPLLEPLLDGNGVVAVEHVAVSAIWDALKLEANHLVNQHADRVAAIVQRHGFTRKQRRRVNGKPELCWIRETEDDTNDA